MMIEHRGASMKEGETLGLPQTGGISQQYPREAGPGFPMSLHVDTEFQSPSLVPLCYGSSCIACLIVLVHPLPVL